MEPTYFIGQVFFDMYPKAAADWANANKAKIIEVDPEEIFENEVARVARKFRIVPLQEEIEEQKKARVLAVRDQYFALYVDWYQSKPLLWSELTKAEKDEIKAYRVYLRDYDDAENWWENEPLDFETWKESK